MTTTRPPGWTAADEAELGVLVHAWIDEAYDHWDAQTCRACAAGMTCDGLERGFNIIHDWYQARCRMSLAAYLRAHQRELERTRLAA